MAGQLQVATALAVLDAVETRLDIVRRRLLDTARHRTGARTLAGRAWNVSRVPAGTRHY